MKICIVGCGAIGGHLAVKMALGGAEVSALCRGATLAAIQAGGLRLETATAQQWTVPILASNDAAALGHQDIVLVAVKTTALNEIAALLPPLLGPDTGVVFMLNGLPWWLLARTAGPQANWSAPVAAMIHALSAVVAPERVIGGIASSANHVKAPGVVWNTSPGGFIFGEPSGGLSGRTNVLADLVNHHESRGTASSTLVDDIWKKLYTNIVSAPLGSLTGAATADLLEDKELAPVIQAMGREMIAVASASGSQNLPADYRYLRGTGLHKSSMLQDVEAGRRPEIDSLTGALTDLARLLAVPIPTIETVSAILKKKARTLGIYP